MKIKRHLRRHQVYEHLAYRGMRWRGKKGAENLFEEIMAENFPYLGKEANTQVQEAQSPKHTTKKPKTNKQTKANIPE